MQTIKSSMYRSSYLPGTGELISVVVVLAWGSKKQNDFII